jgi:RNA polymerase sigma-70 factor (ECF subfamily)
VYADVKPTQPAVLTQSESEKLEQLMQDHGRLVFCIAYSLLRNPHDAEDVTQEVFLRVMRYRYRLAFVRNERTFLGSMARRAALDLRKKRKECISTEDMAEPSVAPQDHVRKQELTMLRMLIESLPAELREALELSQVEGLTSEEIARILGIPAGTVRSRLAQARELLKEKWKGRMEGRNVRSQG